MAQLCNWKECCISIKSKTEITLKTRWISCTLYSYFNFQTLIFKFNLKHCEGKWAFRFLKHDYSSANITDLKKKKRINPITSFHKLFISSPSSWFLVSQSIHHLKTEQPWRRMDDPLLTQAMYVHCFTYTLIDMLRRFLQPQPQQLSPQAQILAKLFWSLLSRPQSSTCNIVTKTGSKL